MAYRDLKLAALLIFLTFHGGKATAQEHVILLHGLCRTKHSMDRMEAALVRAGYHVLNVGYASRSASAASLADQVVGNAVASCLRDGATRIHFVTHSFGGILVRSYLANHSLSSLGRVVMLGPPNQGSELVDRFGSLWLFGVITGPAGRELGTDVDSLPHRLGPAHFELGVIAGNRSLNWLASACIPGHDDGKVSVESTRVAGMTDHIIIAAAHRFLMKTRQAIRQTKHFLQEGAFDHSARGG
jgi:triacylglycerol lipase